MFFDVPLSCSHSYHVLLTSLSFGNYFMFIDVLLLFGHYFMFLKVTIVFLDVLLSCSHSYHVLLTSLSCFLTSFFHPQIISLDGSVAGASDNVGISFSSITSRCHCNVCSHHQFSLCHSYIIFEVLIGKLL